MSNPERKKVDLNSLKAKLAQLHQEAGTKPGTGRFQIHADGTVQMLPKLSPSVSASVSAPQPKKKVTKKISGKSKPEQIKMETVYWPSVRTQK
jgi:hypothetical protein